jgi:phosphatidylglycerophosphatase C
VTRAVAAFDFDGTLTRRDTLLPFLARLAGWPGLLRALAVEVPALVAESARADRRDRTKARVLARTLRGRARDEVDAAGRAYARTLLARSLRPEVVARLREHQDAGHEVVIVSASLDAYLTPVASALGAAALLCTELEVDGSGRCTGRMRGGNCRASEKARRLGAYLAGGPVTLWAYGDSAGDAAMLAMADHAVRIRRGRRYGRSLPANPTASPTRPPASP